MNYSTLKKTVVLSFVSLMVAGMAGAQTATDSTKMMPGSGTPKVLGGTGAYSTFNPGIKGLRQQVEALKARVGNIETAVGNLKKDADGDGVADQFDKCPNTPAGTIVDGAGCPLVIPSIDTSLFLRKAIHWSYGEVIKPYTPIQFEFDSSVLNPESYPILDFISVELKSSGEVCELDGYASSEGTAAHNMRLAKDRANSVKTYLVNTGVAAKKLKVKAFGETHPIADNSTEEGRIKNRRVEFKKK